MPVTVRVLGLTELQRKLDGKFLLTPEMEHVRDALTDRINRPRSKRKQNSGFANNPLAIEKHEIVLSSGLLATVTTPLNNPRNTGSSWTKFVFSLAKGSFLRNQLNAAARRIQARWNS